MWRLAIDRVLCPALAGLLLVATIAACGGRQSGGDLPTARTYTVRGIVRQVQTGPDDRKELSIHHEAIPDFVSINGAVEAMQPMTMPFPVSDSVDLAGIETGAKILFELTVDWSAAEPGVITRLEPLPEDTVLDFDQL